ncbi:MAG: hypothetical protein LQ343_001637 [Gyalolechia ehrenbergii]|nr:MAG: hypothetical protein LQ343_001637 [Gyalolechia ehrenbergii]
MSFLGSLLCCFYFALVAVALGPPPAAPGTDACGPFDHTGDAGFNTCSTQVVASGEPEPYGIICGRDSSMKIPTKIKYCMESAQDMCRWLAQNRLVAGEWHWTGDNMMSPCRVGIYLPAGPGSAPSPNYNRCLNSIYQPMIMGCIYQGAFKVATVNLAALPDISKGSSGKAVNAGYPSYAVSPKAMWYSKVPVATPNVYGDPNGGVQGQSVNYSAVTGYPGSSDYNYPQLAREAADAVSNGSAAG